MLHWMSHPGAVRLTTRQHLDALTAVRDAEVLSYNAIGGAPSWLGRLRFDAVALHTTLVGTRTSPWFSRWRKRLDWLAGLDALKVAFPQDDYDRAHLLDEWLDDLGVSVVCTVLDDTHRDELYPRLSKKAAFYDVLTGYIDEPSAQRMAGRLRPHAERPNDIVYRARHLPYFYGHHGRLKHLIGDAVLERAGAHDLRCDISTSGPETIIGESWLDFMASARATIGVESGVSVLDRAGEMQERVEEMLASDPHLSFEEASARMPPGWDDYRFFAISPRHLEAVITKTAQILTEGRYSGVLEAGRHYLPLAYDFSNLDDVLEQARDVPFMEQLAEQAYADVYLSGKYTYSQLTRVFERVLDEHGATHSGRAGPVFRAAQRLADIEGEAERVVLAPTRNVAHVGWTGIREMAAGARLAARDRDVRALLTAYIRAPELREYVSPRQALENLMCLGVMRRATAGRFDSGEPFAVEATVDETRRRVLFRSRPSHGNGGADGAVGREDIERLMRDSTVDFAWDHSAVARSIDLPIAPTRKLTIALPAGPHPLPVLNWLGRRQPAQVADALAPLLER
jgi:hypothetical protein